MNTKKVRPILIDSKKSIITLKNNHLFYGLGEAHKDYWAQDKQLILISLEDEKIEVGDVTTEYCNIENKWLKPETTKKEWVEKSNYCSKRGTVRKVIATQDQLSLEFIQQLVDEYNNGGMKDFEIEMVEEIFEDTYKPYIEDKGQPAIKAYMAKLTNGFITPVKKQPVLYTEEEVIDLITSAMFNIDWYIHVNKYPDGSIRNIEGVIEWFNQNKKK